MLGVMVLSRRSAGGCEGPWQIIEGGMGPGTAVFGWRVAFPGKPTPPVAENARGVQLASRLTRVAAAVHRLGGARWRRCAVCVRRRWSK